MQMTVVKTREAHDFLALVPELVGFRPENSVVLVAFRGNRTCGALRFSLPEPGAAETLTRRIVTTIVGMMCKIPRVDGLVPVIYTDDRFSDAAGMPADAFARVLIQRSELSGFRVPDAFCVGSDGWGSYLDPDCPADGRPLGDIADSSVHRVIPADKRRGFASLHSGAELPNVDLATKERLARLLRRYRRLASESASAPELVRTIGDVLDPVKTAETLMESGGGAMSVEEAAVLLLLVQSPGTRDQMMLQFAFGEQVGTEVFEVNLHYAAIQRATGLSMDDIVREEMKRKSAEPAGVGGDEPPELPGQQTSELMMGLTVHRPDPERILRAIDLLKAAVATAPRYARPAPFCMLAWLSWALGRGSVAGIFIDRALQIDPGYGMALLLETLIGSGHVPEWAYAVPSHEGKDS
jgi:hypothetical protein